MSSYTAKSSLDSAVVASALAAAMMSLKESGELNLESKEQSNARKELSGQQVATSLLGYSNHITNCCFAQFYWLKLLTWISSELFPAFAQLKNKPYNSNTEPFREVKNDNSNDEISLPDILINSLEEPLVDVDDHNGSLENPHEERQTIHSSEDMIILTSAESDEENIPMLASTIYDIFYCPFECQDICMWDLIAKFEKLSLKKITLQEQMEVLIGYGIPHRNVKSQMNKYATVMLTLFKPWLNDIKLPLKSAAESWRLSFEKFLQQWHWKDVSFRKVHFDGCEVAEGEDLQDDLKWQEGQEDVGGYVENCDRIDESANCNFAEAVGSKTQAEVMTAIIWASKAGLYNLLAKSIDISRTSLELVCEVNVVEGQALANVTNKAIAGACRFVQNC
ncbi:hypothetical protein GYMLUDRAFT_1011361 [Collybiopsis luxurians FD-317 M1]|uniref:Uncharacterized protein n=1 Tax=Collybiopsis luxurians FD-317 M1 TaxID=944289 RepID=A0A0D0B2T9_9AGAR|nr:hypothetical protein GYMLUDRAFT_1011361 [Collybiopsis luxurians FD-317 M1]